MTTTPAPEFDINQAWRDHCIASAAVREVGEDLDLAMRRCMTLIKAYRCHKRRVTTPETCDYGLIAELTLEVEKLVRDDLC